MSAISAPAGPLQRQPGWQQRLAAVANERRTLPYAYGTTDCSCFARAAIEAVTGRVLVADAKPKSKIAAARVMKRRGWHTVEEMMTDLLGAACEPILTQSGDIVSYRMGGEMHLAVRFGDTALSPLSNGLGVIAPQRWHSGWKVG